MPAAARSSKLELVSLTYQLRDARPSTLRAPIVLVLMMVWETNERMSTKTHGTHYEGHIGSASLGWIPSSCPKFPPLTKEYPHLSLNLSLCHKDVSITLKDKFET